MKRLYNIAIVLIGMFFINACQMEEVSAPLNDNKTTVKAYIERQQTKTHMSSLTDGVYKTLWSESDEIMLLSSDSGQPEVFTLLNGAGTTEGVFAGDGKADECLACYPAENVLSMSATGLKVVFPVRQNYVEGSFGKGGFPMLAKGKDGVLNFKNIASVIQVNVTGTRTVDSLVFYKNQSSRGFGGTYHIGIEDDNFGQIIGVYSVQSEDNMFTIDCGSGVQLKEDEVTSFHVVLPPGDHSGFGFRIYTADGVMEKVTKNKLTLQPSQLRAIPPFRFQLETDPDYEEDKIEFEEGKYYVSCVGGDLEVPIMRNVPYTVSLSGYDNGSWIKFIETKSMQSDTLRFYVEPNDRTSGRIGYINLKYAGETQTIEISQRGYEDHYLKVSAKEITMLPEGSVAEVTLTTNREELEFDTDADWIDVTVVDESITLPGNGVDFKQSKTLNLSAGLNDTRAERSGYVVISSLGIKDTITVSQAPAVWGKYEIIVTEPGTLEDIIKGEDIQIYSEIKVSGPVNQDDIIALRRNLENVVILDLSEVSFEGNVLGGFPSLAADRTTTGAFMNLLKLKELYLPPTLVEITHDAFRGCTSLEKVDWGEDSQLHTIGTGIFQSQLFDYWICGGPFAECTSLKTIEIPAKVNTIMAGAFYRSGIEKIVFAENSSMMVFEPTVRYARPPLGAVKPGAETAFPVNFGMFMGCDHLEEIDFPSSVKYVRAGAFMNWTGLKRMTIPESVEYIETESLFSGCVNLESVSLPSSVTKIGAGMFKNCSSLESFDLTGFTSVGNSAFEGCSKISSFEIDHLEEIGSSAFKGTGVMSVRLPDTMTEVPSHLFSYCDKLGEIDFNKAEVLNNWAFGRCYSLESVVLPASVREVHGAFDACANLKSLKITGGTIYFDCAMDGTLEEIIIGKDVVSATSYRGLFGTGGNNTFNNFIFEEGSKLEEFGLCGYLDYMTEFHLPPTVRKLSKNAFAGCKRLTNITEIIANVEEIGDRAFYRTGASSVDFPEGLKRIGDEAFAECEQLVNITLPTTLEYVGSKAFAGNNRLLDPIIHGGNLVLGKSVFSGSTLIHEVVVGAEVLSMSGDLGLDNATVTFQEPSKCTLLEGTLFYGCNSVSLPQGLLVLGDDVFNLNDYITHLEIPEGVTTIGDRTFRECVNLEALVLPENITSVGKDVFYNCGAEGSKLTINFKRLPDQSNGNMFNNHNFSYIELGPDVEYVGQKITAEALYCKGSVPPEIGGKGQINVDVIYVPAASYQAYLSAWSQYADKIQIES